MTITSKYTGRCKKCGGAIAIGDKIDWSKGQGSSHVSCPASPTPVAVNPDQDRVVKHLDALNLDGKLNEFTGSLHAQFASKGYLSDKQIAAVARKLDEPSLPGPDVVPAGRYALTNAEGETYFVRVWRGSRNPTYAKCYLLHGPDESAVATKATLDAIIADGPANAAIRYGHEIGSCCVCGLRLTNHLSRELGIGPVCGGRFYAADDWKATKRDARAKLEAEGIDPDDSVEGGEAS